MKVSQKLQIIQRLSGLSQEKLAARLGVSFATFNSWFNERSSPRKKACEKIDEFYAELTGEKVIPKTVLQAKKQIIEKKKKKYKNILKKIIKSPDIYDRFVLSLTYHTNRIEGSSLTESETAAILFQNIALPDKDLIEQLEVKNHQAALCYLFKYLTSSKEIDEDLILKLHSILMNGIREDAGMYRRHAVRIVGSSIPTANWIKIPKLMERLVDNVKIFPKDIVAHVAKIHSKFEKIHPFSDGNGRLGRLLIDAMLLVRGLPPAIIKQEKKQFYYSSLAKAQEKNDTSLLEDFICDAILEGFGIIKRGGG